MLISMIFWYEQGFSWIVLSALFTAHGPDVTVIPVNLALNELRLDQNCESQAVDNLNENLMSGMDVLRNLSQARP